MYKHFFKRMFDIILALLGIIIGGIPMLIIALWVKLDSKGPVLFKQERIGKKGKVFKIYKFRSMCVGAEKGGVYSDNKDTRVTEPVNSSVPPAWMSCPSFLMFCSDT